MLNRIASLKAKWASRAASYFGPFWWKVIVTSFYAAVAFVLLCYGLDLWGSLPEFTMEMRERYFYLCGLDAWGPGCSPAEMVELEKLIELANVHGGMAWTGLFAVSGAGLFGYFAKKEWKKG